LSYFHGNETRTILVVLDSLTGEGRLEELEVDGRLRLLVAGNPSLPLVSSDNELVAFETSVGGRAAVVLGRDGTVLQRLDAGTVSHGFSPDSKRLIYIHRNAGLGELYILDIFSGASTRVTETSDDEVDANFLDESNIVLRRLVRGSQLLRADVGALLR